MKRLVTMFIAAVLVLTACQSVSETVTEQILEEAVGGGDASVEIDTDTGEFQIEIESDGESISIGGGELPEGFSTPLPDGYEVTMVFSADDESSVTVSYQPDRYDELVSYFDEWTSGQPGEWNTQTMTLDQGTAGTMRSSTWFEGDVSISVTDCFDFNLDTDNFNAVCVNVING